MGKSQSNPFLNVTLCLLMPIKTSIYDFSQTHLCYKGSRYICLIPFHHLRLIRTVGLLRERVTAANIFSSLFYQPLKSQAFVVHSSRCTEYLGCECSVFNVVNSP